MRLENKIAVIIGASPGASMGDAIGNGRATALLFAREGATVCCVDSNLKSTSDLGDDHSGGRHCDGARR